MKQVRFVSLLLASVLGIVLGAWTVKTMPADAASDGWNPGAREALASLVTEETSRGRCSLEVSGSGREQTTFGELCSGTIFRFQPEGPALYKAGQTMVIKVTMVATDEGPAWTVKSSAPEVLVSHHVLESAVYPATN